MTTINSNRDGAKQSPWQSAGKRATAATPENKTYDCLIVGGGITGLTAALLLQKAGRQTVIAEAHTAGFGTTGGTSAHINTFADTPYSKAESTFGADGAQGFADAINGGLNLIRNNISSYNISCDYELKPGYLYAENEEEAKQLDDIYQGTVKAGVAAAYTDEVPTPVPFRKALIFEGQAQFHPVKYLDGLQKAYLEAGGTLSENTLVEGIDSENGIHTAHAGEKSIRAKAVIYATHMPPNITLLNFECVPYRSYVIAVELENGQYPDALIYDSQEPYHYMRSHVIDGKALLLIGGCDHKTGHGDPAQAFASLEEYTRKYYKVSSVRYRWSSQYYAPIDGFPYIGQLPMMADGIYCATGYNGNGMMLGSIAGQILADLVSGKGSSYEKLFSPSRIKPIDGFSEFVKENVDVAYHFIADRWSIKDTDTLKGLPPGTGKVVEVNGKKIAAYRDDAGAIHALNPVCTHAACIVGWNGEEKSWDCPCHGARYDIDGNVLTGPATKKLTKINNDED